jgi:hypothetical protein
VDRHRFDADPDPDPNFHVDASQGPDPDPDWHQNYAVPHADPTPSFTHVGNLFFFTFSYIIATLLCFIFHISVKCVKCFQYFGQHIEIFWKKCLIYQLFRLLGIDTDPNLAK